MDFTNGIFAHGYYKFSMVDDKNWLIDCCGDEAIGCGTVRGWDHCCEDGVGMVINAVGMGANSSPVSLSIQTLIINRQELQSAYCSLTQ